MLHELARYAEAQGLISAPGFATRKVHWQVDVTADGQFRGVQDLREGGSGKAWQGCPNLLQPELLSGGPDRPLSHFLVESAGLLLDYPSSGTPAKLDRILKKREVFTQMIELSRESRDSLAWLAGAALFLRSPSEVSRARQRLTQVGGAATHAVVISVEGRNPLTTKDWHDWWKEHRASLLRRPNQRKRKAEARDLMSGTLVSPELNHPRVKGLAGTGGLSTGDSLISFDKSAFVSYGLQRAKNAPLAAESATTYVAALDHLIARGPSLGGCKICHWYSSPPDDDPLAALLKPDVRSVGGGEREACFYLLTLSGHSGRVMVRDWSQGDVAMLRRTSAAWFHDLAMVSRDGTSLAPSPALADVLASLYRDPRKEISSPLVADLLHRAVFGQALPSTILFLALRRVRFDMVDPERPPLNSVRMGLLKAYLNRLSQETTISTHLRTDHPRPSYQCGRLLALLGQTGKRLATRAYGLASQAPGSALVPLLERVWSRQSLEQRRAISELLRRLDSKLPEALGLDDQALFALGYYQQMAASQKLDSERWDNLRRPPEYHQEIDDDPYAD